MAKQRHVKDATSRVVIHTPGEAASESQRGKTESG